MTPQEYESLDKELGVLLEKCGPCPEGGIDPKTLSESDRLRLEELTQLIAAEDDKDDWGSV